MKLIGYKKSGRDVEIKIPVWMINDRELWLIYCAMTKMKLYVPDLMFPDTARISDLMGKINTYLGDKRNHQKRIIWKEVRSGMLDEWVEDSSAFDKDGKKIKK